MHAGSPCDAVSWAPCDRPHRQPKKRRRRAAIARSTNRETLAARVGRVTTPAVK